MQGKKHIVPSFKVLASQYESVLPLPRDEEVASLEHLLEASSADQSELPATPREQGAQRVEAIIERVCSIKSLLFSPLLLIHSAVFVVGQICHTQDKGTPP